MLLVVACLFALSSAARTQAPAQKKLLFLTHAGLYKNPSLEPAKAAVTDYGKTGGFDVTALQGFKQDLKA